MLAFVTRVPIKPGDVPSTVTFSRLRLPTLPVPVGSGPASSSPPPEGVNIGGELAGKFLRCMPEPDTAGRLDVCGGLWQYSPPRFTNPDHLPSIPAPDLRIATVRHPSPDCSWIL
ncbi:hypothetical protein GCM10010145_08820 [Streptomyces ruber]|uniref:Uncharacterized protein n=2 Tax=Streptomyces TaxID=1883 RepID=A0A918B9X8_9ACTN|nr:hypothetical protein GCM10010145_08820 [Streptomyces ruber]